MANLQNDPLGMSVRESTNDRTRTLEMRVRGNPSLEGSRTLIISRFGDRPFRTINPRTLEGGSEQSPSTAKLVSWA